MQVSQDTLLELSKKLQPGTEVYVDCPRYNGPGGVSDQTRSGAHIFCFGVDHGRTKHVFYVAVMIPNGNIHRYPIGAVEVAE